MKNENFIFGWLFISLIICSFATPIAVVHIFNDNQDVAMGIFIGMVLMGFVYIVPFTAAIFELKMKVWIRRIE